MPAEVALASRPGPRPARRRAHRAQLPRPPLRGRDADRPLRRGRGRDRRRDPRHPQDDPGPARAREGGGRRRRRPQPPHRPLRRDPDQGEPHRRSPAASPRRSTAPARRSPSSRSRSSAATSTRSPTRSAPAPTGCCSTTWTPTTLREAVRLRDENSGAGKGPSLEASGGVTLETVRGDRRDRRRPDLGRRPDPLGPDPRLLASCSSPREPQPLSGSPPATRRLEAAAAAHFNNFDNRRSLSTRPSVCSSGQ